MTDQTFEIAEKHLSSEEILSCIQRWIKDDRQVEFIAAAKSHIDVSNYYDLTRRVICPARSHGKLGGKSSGLFLAAQILRKSTEYADALKHIRIPKTWWVASDGVLNFIEHNNLEDLYNRRYLEIEQVRREYPHIIQVFKNSHFSPEIVRGLSLALDDFEERPIIVRAMNSSWRSSLIHLWMHERISSERLQSYGEDTVSAPIPEDPPKESVVFTANRYISNGRVPDATHIVYVDPEAYARIPDLADLRRVGRAVGRLNKLLPKRRFILMGPGRWGSRGDVKLGVNVTYSDINNSSVLIEIARRHGSYVPDLRSRGRRVMPRRSAPSDAAHELRLKAPARTTTASASP